MSDNLLTEAQNPGRPAGIPEKFWDMKTNQLRSDALVKSYLELEKKMGKMVDPSDTSRIHQMMGVPASPADYCINCDHGMFTPDEMLNSKMHEAGFAPHQAQLVYDMAAERMVPMILEVAKEYESEREQERLVAEFGGRERWLELSRQIQTWASANLPPEAVKGLSTTFDGVMALYRMMQDSGESMPVQGEGAPSLSGSDDLSAMMRDPRYWQKKDPNYVAKVTAAFERRYRA
jgi:hypothetical protein